MSNNGSGGKLEGFFAGKGFYIVLFLCAAVIGVSAWVMAVGNKTMAENVTAKNGVSLENKRVETVIIPAQPEEAESVMQTEEELLPVEAPPISEEGLAQVSEAEAETEEVWCEGDVMEVVGPVYVWPVSGQLQRQYSGDKLSYDETLGDWRTHEGIDIVAPLGSSVGAAHAGTVESVYEDDLFGWVVVVDHGDGAKSVYANLAESPVVSVGQWVEGGTEVGLVGDTALCEAAQEAHLHYVLSVDGEKVDPLNFLPA